MNQLVKELIRPLLENNQKVTAVYGGGFKPPIKGHFGLAQKALKDLPEIDNFIIYVGGGVRDGITQEQSMAIWDVYKEILGPKVQIEPSVQPIKDVLRYAKDHPDEKVYFVIGYREGREDDLKDIASRTKGVEEKYPNLEVKVIKTLDPEVSGTNARKALQKGDKEKFFTFLPDEVPANEKEEIYSIVTKAIVREADPNHTGKSAPFGSGYKPLKENTIPSIDILEKIAELTLYMREKGYNIDPVPSITIIDNDMENAGEFLGKTAYYDPINKSITLYTYGRHPKDIVRSYAHEMIHHIQNLEGRLGDVSTTNTLEDDHINDLEKEANLKGTMTFRNWTDSLQEDGQKTSNKNMDNYKKQNNPSGKVKDPFGLNAFAYELARLGEEQLNEGRYDKFTNELSSFAFELMKDGYDVGRKVVDETFTVGPADEDPDIISDDFEFDFYVQAVYTDDTYTVDGGANAGYDDKKDEITPLLSVRFEIPKDIDWQTVSFDLKDVIRHELEHLTQDGANLRPGKKMEDDEFIRDMINADLLPKSDYFKLEKEIDAMLQGLYLKAKKSRKPYLEVIDDYLDKQPITQEERKDILDLWAKRAKALSLPTFTSTYVKESSHLYDTGVKKKKYYIFSDMDGVLADFDKGYKDLTGMATHHADTQGKTEFWKIFRDSLKEKGMSEKEYWASLDWMPDGKKYWDYIKKYNPYVLTAPSVNFDAPADQRYSPEYNESMQGKTEWSQRLSNMRKMYFASAKNKVKFARPDSILIDDRKDTIDAWNSAGGIGIFHTSAEDTIKQLQDLGL
jgi:hypothetical protein